MKQFVSGEAVLAYARERFGAAPEFLWASHPAYAVLRRQDSRKWFGVVMNVSPKALGLPDGGGVEILNVKCDPLLLGSLREGPGFFPAYHMNKSSWITVLLDGTVSLEEIAGLLELSYDLAGPSKSNKKTR